MECKEPAVWSNSFKGFMPNRLYLYGFHQFPSHRLSGVMVFQLRQTWCG